MSNNSEPTQANQDERRRIGANVPFDQDVHDYAYVVPGEKAGEEDNVRSITTAPSFHDKRMHKAEAPEEIESDPVGKISRDLVAQKASKWLLGGAIDRTPRSMAVAAARKRQFITDQTRKLTGPR